MKTPILLDIRCRDQGGSDGTKACDKCTVRSKAICAELSPEEISGLNQIARHRRLRSGQQINPSVESTEYFAIVVSGAVKQTKVLPDGRQQIVGLLFPSDFLGIPFERRSSAQSEAATDLQLCSFPAAPFERLISQYPNIQNRLFRYAYAQLDAAQDWMLLLGRKTAREKVASLFVMVAKRSRGLDCCGADAAGRERFELPLNRSDMADYLGLTLETVSRQLKILKDEMIIRFDGPRNVVILDPERLSEAASTPFL